LTGHPSLFMRFGRQIVFFYFYSQCLSPLFLFTDFIMMLALFGHLYPVARLRSRGSHVLLGPKRIEEIFFFFFQCFPWIARCHSPFLLAFHVGEVFSSLHCAVDEDFHFLFSLSASFDSSAIFFFHDSTNPTLSGAHAALFSSFFLCFFEIERFSVNFVARDVFRQHVDWNFLSVFRFLLPGKPFSWTTIELSTSRLLVFARPESAPCSADNYEIRKVPFFFLLIPFGSTLPTSSNPRLPRSSQRPSPFLRLIGSPFPSRCLFLLSFPCTRPSSFEVTRGSNSSIRSVLFFFFPRSNIPFLPAPFSLFAFFFPHPFFSRSRFILSDVKDSKRSRRQGLLFF